ncbi:putative amino-acid ABC transporter permease protein YhdX [Hyella patelloides LEGE 07179]|uniref:Putative amino-acid ABC transporter permease protein YhdX n=1 Tax=Hyella patelloides LEGE 07179 TaxID=945734 RepID=A0A563VZL2_9CYAN|nr:ABC transporter permease subunit [Hyella patelloides]VEP16860.1 putative amino-acid ABC transporter permease protein YhdX [Hyella patelloides LEGE 07179]
MSQTEKIPFWRDSRILNIIAQVVILTMVISIFIFFGNNLVNNFRRLGLTFGFNFLTRSASFAIANPPFEYSPSDPYFKAILVGLINSLKVMFFGIIIATILGITVGLGRLSNNWLVRKLATIYVETLRNTPLLLQLFFWYFAVFLRLPRIENAFNISNTIFLSNRGMRIPWFVSNLQTILSSILILTAIILAVLFWKKRVDTIEEMGESGQDWLNLLIASLVITVATFFFGIDWNIPQYEGNSLAGGTNLSPEFATLLIGLSIYTASFIAEVVRAGIQSVNKGQWEAARALGLEPGLVMQLVIFPQALRVMIPPLTSEFLNLAKNSSLAIAIGYNDVYAISNTISNQTGKAVEILLILVGIYLTINLIISLAMNWLNKSVQLKER